MAIPAASSIPSIFSHKLASSLTNSAALQREQAEWSSISALTVLDMQVISCLSYMQ
jgi:hypothetical protein